MNSQPPWTFVPFFPNGSTLRSIANAMVLQSGALRKQHVLEMLFEEGRAVFPPMHMFGQGACSAAVAVRGEGADVLAFARAHSCYGIVEKFLGVAACARILRAPEFFHSCSARLLMRPLPLYQGARWCALCCMEDLNLAVGPHWKAHHQLKFLNHCPLHGAKLIDRCAACAPKGKSSENWELPPEPCAVCMCSATDVNFADLPAAYVRLLSDSHHILFTESAWDPSAWTPAMNDFVNKNGLPAKVIDTDGQQQWQGTPWSEFALQASCGLSGSFVFKQLMRLDFARRMIPDLAPPWSLRWS